MKKYPILELVVKIASRCNLNCSYCYEYNMGDDSWKKAAKFMSDETAELLGKRINENMPRKIALGIVVIDLLYFLNHLLAMPEFNQLQTPLVADPSTWIMHFKADWIPAFGISIELALDGISLLMVLLTLDGLQKVLNSLGL